MVAVSVERCLDIIPNKFKLAIITMNRARSILLGNHTDIENTKYTKKSINKTLREIEDNKLDLDLIEKEIRKNLLINNLFSKSFRLSSDDENIESENNVVDFNLKDEDLSSNLEDVIDIEEDTEIEDDVDIESE